MSILDVILLLLSSLIGLLLVLVAWGFWRTYGRERSTGAIRSHDDLLFALMIFAAFAVGIFVTYALLATAV